MALKVDEFCSFLATRNLPDWMVAQLRTNLEEKASPDVTSAPLTTETLAEMGIAHPLHQRRILREVQCFMKSAEAAESSIPTAPGSRPKAKIKPRQMVYERDTRWPYLDIACVKLLKDEPKIATPYGHWQRRMALEAKTNVGKDNCLRMRSKESVTSFGKTKSDLSEGFEEDGTPTATKDVADDDGMVSDLSEGPSMDWQDWLSSRLHSWGMLSLVDEVLKVAVLGNLTELRELVLQVQAHGTGFAESLEKTPVPSHVPVFPDAPEEDIPPCTIWKWVMWRLDSLERADTRLQKLLNKCEDLADQVMGYSKVTREISIKPASHKKKGTFNMKKLMMGVSVVSAVSAVSASSAASDAPPRSSSSVILESTSSAVRMKNEAKPSALERFRKVAQLILSHIKGKRQEGLVASTKLLTCVAMQSKVTNLRHDLENMMEDLDKWPHLISENRQSCESMVTRLHQASQSLFSRFVDLRQHVELELREATIGDQGTVETCRLENKIVDVQREMASSLLLGTHALQMAENAGVGLQANGIPEPPNPWEGLILPEPPWEASFLRALRKLEPLRRNLQFRRQGTALTVTSRPKRLKSASKSSRFRNMKPGQSIPEELLAQLLQR